jgi:phosphatidylglycerol---prolipoprotein diacylglyceryl transferase
MNKLTAAGIGVVLSAALIYLFLMPVFRGDIILSPGFDLGGFRLHYYGLIFGAAILASYLVSRAHSWRFGISKDEVDRFAFWAVIVSFICARLYFVIFSWSQFSSVVDIFKIWEGGLSIFGAIIGGAAFTYIYTRKKAYSYWQLLDAAALGLPLGQAIGRWGNFFNYEAYGKETNLPWKMFVTETENFHHPAFLYESLASLLLFFVLLKYCGRLKSGNLALIYLMGYSVIRFALELIRVDTLLVAGWNVNQAVALVVFVAAFLTWKKRAKVV